MKTQRKIPLEFKYSGICRLESCGAPFKTNREWQEFCHPKHQVKFWIGKKSEQSYIRKKLEDHEKRIEKLEERQGIDLV